jgi:hypothetical protein
VSDSKCEVQLGQIFSLCPSSFINNPYRTDQNTNVSFAIITTDSNLLAAKIPILNVNSKNYFDLNNENLIFKVLFKPTSRSLISGGSCHNDPHCKTHDGT